jgi:hypothetical protein
MSEFEVPRAGYLAAFEAVCVSEGSPAAARYRKAIDAAVPFILAEAARDIIRALDSRARRAAMAGNKRESLFCSSLVKDIKGALGE